MQALTGLFARQFGTPNYAAHGGFCSVNMAAGMIYTIGGSFWEFGGPDLERAKLFVMIGTAEDHHSNPMKVALAKFKRQGGASSPSTRYAPATRPSPTSGCRSAGHRRRAAARAHPRDHRAGPVRPRVPGALHQRRPAGEPGRGDSDDFGLMLRNAEGDVVNPLRPHNFWWDRLTHKPVADHRGRRPGAAGQDARRPDGTAARRSSCSRSACASTRPSGRRASPASRPRPSAACARDGHHRARPEDRTADRLDRLLGQTPRHGDRQPGGLPRHARPGGAQQRLSHHPHAGDPDEPAGTIDRPGGFRHKAPHYPRAVPPNARPPKGPRRSSPTRR